MLFKFAKQCDYCGCGVSRYKWGYQCINCGAMGDPYLGMMSEPKRFPSWYEYEEDIEASWSMGEKLKTDGYKIGPLFVKKMVDFLNPSEE